MDLLTKNPSDPNVREALMYALRYDSNPGVRLKALEGVGPFVKSDTRVRNAVLEALLNDSNTGMRARHCICWARCGRMAAFGQCSQDWQSQTAINTSVHRRGLN